MGAIQILIDDRKPCLPIEQVYLERRPDDVRLLRAGKDFDYPHPLAVHTSSCGRPSSRVEPQSVVSRRYSDGSQWPIAGTYYVSLFHVSWSPVPVFTKGTAVRLVLSDTGEGTWCSYLQRWVQRPVKVDRSVSIQEMTQPASNIASTLETGIPRGVPLLTRE